LKKTKDAGDAAWGVVIIGFATFSMSDIPIAQLFLIVFGLYIVIYAYRAERILDAFHQSHPENISEAVQPGEVVNASSAAGLSENQLHD